MPTTEGSAEEGQPSGNREDRITQLKPPAPLDFEAINLADSWKRWRQEVELYMDLAMCGREESMKVKLFLYLLESQGREIYSTMAFEAPGHKRNLKQVMDAFDQHCNPKKSETVERYKFFSRFQNPGESLEKFITDLKLLATTCNFGDLKDSLVRDQIISGIQDKQLREDLLKDPCLDLQRCLDACRAAELSKERSKTLEEGENVNSLRDQMKRGKASDDKRRKKVDKRRESEERREKSENNRRENESPVHDAYHKETKKCKYCGGKHRFGKRNCPAFGKRCSACGL